MRNWLGADLRLVVAVVAYWSCVVDDRVETKKEYWYINIHGGRVDIN